MTLTLPLDRVGSADLPLVGGKAANLGELIRAGFPVPQGFCVTTEAFVRFVAGSDEDLYRRLDGLDPTDLARLREVGAALRARLESLPLPTEVEQAVLTAWRELGTERACAVRSSATAEDLPHASFAGQQDTFLNIRGERDLLAAIESCFASLFSDRAILYRVQNGFDHRAVALAVVVQQMVQSEVAGILFTADPVSGRRSTLVIDAGFGLGEALVSGMVSADLYRVDKPTRTIVERQIASKRIAVRSRADSGTEVVELSAAERERTALDDRQVLALAELGMAVEAHYRRPQDIEWAIAGDTIHLTQSRPITSLFPLPEPRPTDDALHVYFSMSHFQVMTDAMPPMALSVLRTITGFAPAGAPPERGLTQSAGGRLYVDLSPVLRHPLGKRLLLRVLGNADQLAVGAIAELATRPDFRARGARFDPLRMLPRLRPYAFRMLRTLWRGTPEEIPAQIEAIMSAHLAAAESRLNAATTTEERLAFVVAELRALFPTIFGWIPHLAAGVVGAQGVRRLLGNRVDPGELAALGRGLLGNVATEMDLAVGDLADAARASDALRDHLADSGLDPCSRLAGAAEFEGGAEFLARWNEFLAIYGARGPSEIDLSRPRWAEDPGSLLQMVVNATAHREAGAHRRHYRRLIDEGEAAAEAVIAAAHRGIPGPVRGALVRRFVRVSRTLLPLREHHKFLAVQLLALVKPVLLQAGAELNRHGRLDSAADVWFLELPELLAAFGRPAGDLNPLVAERRSNFEHHQRLSPPRVITSDGEIPPLGLDSDAPDGALVGSPVSAGVVEGVARVVLDPARDALRPGEILVAPFTDPGWTPLFVNAAGLVTEVGGLMTHGSVVAREYGIPAVVGVIDATTRIESGQRLRVHGDAGYVEFLDHDTPDVPETAPGNSDEGAVSA